MSSRRYPTRRGATLVSLLLAVVSACGAVRLPRRRCADPHADRGADDVGAGPHRARDVGPAVDPFVAPHTFVCLAEDPNQAQVTIGWDVPTASDVEIRLDGVPVPSGSAPSCRSRCPPAARAAGIGSTVVFDCDASEAWTITIQWTAHGSPPTVKVVHVVHEADDGAEQRPLGSDHGCSRRAFVAGAAGLLGVRYLAACGGGDGASTAWPNSRRCGRPATRGLATTLRVATGARADGRQRRRRHHLPRASCPGRDGSRRAPASCSSVDLVNALGQATNLHRARAARTRPRRPADDVPARRVCARRTTYSYAVPRCPRTTRRAPTGTTPTGTRSRTTRSSVASSA